MTDFSADDEHSTNNVLHRNEGWDLGRNLRNGTGLAGEIGRDIDECGEEGNVAW